MRIKIFPAAMLVFITACHSSTNNKQEAIDQLNSRSKDCIRIMNAAEEKKNAALAAGDGITATAMQKTMDSAAMENVKIGQELMEMQNSK